MAVRAVFGALGRRLWQGSKNFSVSSSRSNIAKNDGFLLSTSMKWVQFSNLHVDVPKDLTKPTITISDEPDTLYKRLSVLVKGHDKAVLDSYEYFAVLAAKELGISVKVHEPPRKIERFTLLKSVHIFKKHRVQYEMRTLYRCLELEHLTGSTADVYLEYIQRNLPEGVAMEVTKFTDKTDEKGETDEFQLLTTETAASEPNFERLGWDFPGGPVVENPSANAGDMSSLPGPGRLHMPQND